MGVVSPSGKESESFSDSNSVEARLDARRWRVLRAVLPYGTVSQPAWVRSFDEFIWWVASESSQQGLRTYLKDLEEIAKQTCDLVLLRLARYHISS